MVSFIIFALVGVAAIFVYGWLFGISSLIMKIQRRISSTEGMMAFTSYVEQHSDIMQLSETKLDDSIKLVVVFLYELIFLVENQGWLQREGRTQETI